MTIDMSQFFQVFFDECAEHLASMESLLLGVDPQAPDPEELNAIFRAAHSIKGGAGTFGFTEIAQTTHSLETLLDRLRKGELALRPEMIDAFLRAKDVLADLLALRRGEASTLDDPQAASEVMQWLDRLGMDEDSESAVTSPDAAPASMRAGERGAASSAAPPTPAAVLAASAGDSSAARRRFDLSIDASGVDQPALERLFDELREIGTLEIVASPPVRKPRMSRSGPLTWRLVLVTGNDEGSLRDLFEFVVPASQLEMSSVLLDAPEPVATDSAAVAVPEVEVEDEVGYGFFTDVLSPEATDSAPAAQEQGFGFFDDAPGAPSAATATAIDPTAPASEPFAQSPGRRAMDHAGDAPVRAGRRVTDKQVVASGDAASIRVGVEKVDTLMNLVSELVITQSMLMQSATHLDPVQHERLLAGVGLLERNTRDLQEAVMSIRMLPISFVFSRFPRVVRDLASKLGKQVELKTEGESAELDKGLIEKIADPLTHLVRNSLDHGIESPAVRRAAGKPETGTITLRAMHQGGSILIEVADDGAGLDRERILAKARERGLAVSDTMTDAEVWQIIFEPGFSTAATVTDVSGRGVGMDVVMRNIAEMNGSVSIDSLAGHGTRMTIRLPLTMAILDGLSVRVGDSTLIVPLNSIIESLQPKPGQLRTIGGRARTVSVRGEYLNVIELRRVFNVDAAEREGEPVMVIVESAGQKAALCVDELLGQHQVVIKSLETNYRRVRGISGATIMGDGHVALIVDVPGVVRAGAELPVAA